MSLDDMVTLCITAILHGDQVNYEDYTRSVNLVYWQTLFPNTTPHEVLKSKVQTALLVFDDVLPEWRKMLVRQNEVHELQNICKNKAQRDLWKMNFAMAQQQQQANFKQYELAYVLNRAFRDWRRKLFYCPLEMLMEPVTGSQMRRVVSYIEKNAMKFQIDRYRNVALMADAEKKLILTKQTSFTQYFDPLEKIVNWDDEFLIDFVRAFFQNVFEKLECKAPKQKPLKPFARIAPGPSVTTLIPVAPASRVVFTPVAHCGVMSSLIPLNPAARVLFPKPPPLPSPPSTPPPPFVTEPSSPLKQDGFLMAAEVDNPMRRSEEVDDYVVQCKRQKIPSLVDAMMESSRLWFLPAPRLLSDPW